MKNELLSDEDINLIEKACWESYTGKQSRFNYKMFARSIEWVIRQKIKNILEETLSSSEDKGVPLLHPDGSLHQFMVKDSTGTSFRCECGCNVFHKPDINELEMYECNACGNQYKSY
jgi:hypothetical protein